MAPRKDCNLEMDSPIPQEDSRKKGSMLSISTVDVIVDDISPLCNSKNAANQGTASLDLTALEIEAANRHERKRLERSDKPRQCDFEEFLNNRQDSQHFTGSSIDALKNRNGCKSANQKTRRNAMHFRTSNEEDNDNDSNAVQNSPDLYRERRAATCDTVDKTQARRTRQRVMRKRLTFREIDCQSV